MPPQTHQVLRHLITAGSITNVEAHAVLKCRSVSKRISELVNGLRPITADTALRLGLFFGMEPRFWINLQTEYDMRVAVRTLQEKIAPRIRAFQRTSA